MGISAAVVGASGYAGGEVLRLLHGHPQLEIGAVIAHSNAGRPLTELHPQLVQLTDLQLQALEPGVLDGADVVFLALPHGHSGAVAASLPDDTVVIDLGADHRLADPAQWSRFYGGEHAGTWTYGLPELPGAREQLAGAKRVAAPGCYPSAVGLALVPLFTADLLEPDDVVVVAASGTSGAGRSPSVKLLGSEVMGSLSAYKAGGVHQHTPEMAQCLSAAAGTAVTVSFTPVLAPMPRGILATCTARLAAGVDAASLRDVLAGAYTDEPFVHVLPEVTWPSTAAVSGSNSAHLQVAVDAAVGRAVVIAAIDNLGKGAAGQAVQCANLALGLPETAGLSANGLAP